MSVSIFLQTFEASGHFIFNYMHVQRNCKLSRTLLLLDRDTVYRKFSVVEKFITPPRNKIWELQCSIILTYAQCPLCLIFQLVKKGRDRTIVNGFEAIISTYLSGLLRLYPVKEKTPTLLIAMQ